MLAKAVESYMVGLSRSRFTAATISLAAVRVVSPWATCSTRGQILDREMGSKMSRDNHPGNRPNVRRTHRDREKSTRPKREGTELAGVGIVGIDDVGDAKTEGDHEAGQQHEELKQVGVNDSHETAGGAVDHDHDAADQDRPA